MGGIHTKRPTSVFFGKYDSKLTRKRESMHKKYHIDLIDRRPNFDEQE
jgi:hypothetical protein